MTENTDKLMAEMERNTELYAPIIKWCELLQIPFVPDASKVDKTAEFYRALDKIVRRDEFSLETMSQIMAANWYGDTGDPECAEYYDEICWRALAVRQYLEARGEVKMLAPRTDGPALH
jgi:hypothetical protein